MGWPHWMRCSPLPPLHPQGPVLGTELAEPRGRGPRDEDTMETPSSWRKGNGIPDGRHGADGKIGINETAWLGPKGGLYKASIPVGENLMHTEKQTGPSF